MAKRIGDDALSKGTALRAEAETLRDKAQSNADALDTAIARIVSEQDELARQKKRLSAVARQNSQLATILNRWIDSIVLLDEELK